MLQSPADKSGKI